MDGRKEIALSVVKRLNSKGFEAYLVGGCVRDLLLRRTPKDYDVATSALPQEVQAIFERTIPTGLQHGTITVLWDHEPVEVTTFRSEGVYEDHRRPSSVSFVRSLRKDLERRDFTINAMAMDDLGKIYDFFEGQADLEKRMIRTVGRAEERFTEDALRMVRAARFAAQFSFEIDLGTWKAMKKLRHTGRHLSVERVVTELEKIWVGESPDRGIQTLIETGVLTFLPPFYQWDFDEDRLLEYIYALKKGVDRYIAWALLLDSFSTTAHSSGKRVRELRLSKKDGEKVYLLFQFVEDLYHEKQLDECWFKKQLLNYGLETVLLAVQYLKIKKWNQIEQSEKQIITWWNEIPVKLLSDLCIKGNELIQAAKIPAGPWVKKTLNMLLIQVALEEIPNEKEILLKVGTAIGTKYSR